jgi:hypothetical protein
MPGTAWVVGENRGVNQQPSGTAWRLRQHKDTAQAHSFARVSAPPCRSHLVDLHQVVLLWPVSARAGSKDMESGASGVLFSKEQPLLCRPATSARRRPMPSFGARPEPHQGTTPRPRPRRGLTLFVAPAYSPVRFGGRVGRCGGSVWSSGRRSAPDSQGLTAASPTHRAGRAAVPNVSAPTHASPTRWAPGIAHSSCRRGRGHALLPSPQLQAGRAHPWTTAGRGGVPEREGRFQTLAPHAKQPRISGPN